MSWTSTLQWISAMTPQWGWSVQKNHIYGPHPRHRLDLYVPNSPRPGKPPVVFFNGGGWQFGSKDEHKFIGAFLAGNGYTCAVANYRLWPEVTANAFMDDGANAVNKVAALTGKIPVVMGHSAGAQIASVCALGWPSAAGAICLANPFYDYIPMPEQLPPEWQEITQIFPPDTRERAIAANHLDRYDPRLLLMVGSRDEYDYGATERMRVAAEAATVPVTKRVYGGVDHFGIVTGFAPFWPYANSAMKNDVLAWLGTL